MNSKIITICKKDSKAFWKKCMIPFEALIMYYAIIILITIWIPFEYYGIVNLVNNSVNTSTQIISLFMIYFFVILFHLVVRYEKFKFYNITIYDRGLLITNKIHFYDYGLNGTPSPNVLFDSINKIKIEMQKDIWVCTFVSTLDETYIIKSTESYNLECLKNLIKLSEELKQKGIEVEISDGAIKLAYEREK